MWKSKLWLSWSATMILLTSGCVPLVVGGAAVGTGAGTYLYINGAMQAEYDAPYEKVWTACERTLADMRALDVLPYKEIGKGTISAIINEGKIQLSIQYKTKNITIVAVRVGIFGDRTASQLIQDKIAENLSKY